MLVKDCHLHLSFLSDASYNFEDMYKRSVNFVSKWYGMNPCDTMNKLRYKCWLKMIGNAKTLCPPLENLSPTDAGFVEHVKRAIYQLMVWENADKGNTVSVDATEWGWHYIDNQLMPTMTPVNIEIAPDFVLNLIKCGCKALADRCKTKRCSCASNSLLCTKFCNCGLDDIKCSRSQEVDLDSNEVNETYLEMNCDDEEGSDD